MAPDEMKRSLNLGKVVQLKGVPGDVTVKEIPFRSLLQLSNELAALAQRFTTGTQESMLEQVAAVIADEDAFVFLCRVTQACSGLSEDTLKDLGVGDWLRLITTMQAVFDWEELKELFFQLRGKQAQPEASSQS